MVRGSNWQKYKNRQDAGRLLAKSLSRFSRHPTALVLALPRGGVPVASEVAKALQLPMDVFLVRKLGVPGHEEFAMGAIASGGFRFLNQQVIADLGLSASSVQQVIEKQEEELARREIEYGYSLPPINGRTIILVDDGFATGSTMKVAIEALRVAGVQSIIAASPVGSPEACEDLKRVADEVECPVMPKNFQAVGQFYEDFSQTSDEEVRRVLDQMRSVKEESHPSG